MAASLPKRSPNRYFVIHTFPDADLIAASWLGVRYLFPRLFGDQALEPRFVPFNQIDQDVLSKATAIFDIGGEFDPKRLRFDHHQAPDPRATCAAQLVWRHLVYGDGQEQPVCPELIYLDPLIDLITAGDTDTLEARGYTLSRTLGLHALLAGFRTLQEEITVQTHQQTDQATQMTLMHGLDLATLHYGWGLLDHLAIGLRRGTEVATHVLDHLVYKSADGLVWALDRAPLRSAKEAFNRGARLVITHSTYPLPTSYMLEVWGASEEQGPDIKILIQRAMEAARERGDSTRYRELELFYAERTYAGRGSPKAPNPNPINIDLVDFTRELDRLWQRGGTDS